MFLIELVVVWEWKLNVNSAHLKEGESINADNWKTEFGLNEAARKQFNMLGNTILML